MQSAVVALFLLGLLSPVAHSLSLWESQFSTTEFAHYRYKDLITLSIFQHLSKNTSFYVTPLMLLDHRSGVLRHNALTEFFELRFKVLMWNLEFLESVSAYLTSVKGVRLPEVKMLPMEKVRFEWGSSTRPMKTGVILENEFMTTHHLPRYLTLTFACKSHPTCDALHRQVQRNPEILDSLAMHCFMTAQKSDTKTITVTVDNVAKTRTFSKLSMLPPDKNYWYMRGSDFNNMAQEVFSSVRATSIRSNEYVDKFDELNVMKILQDSLKQDEISTSSLTATQWDSVFWDPAFARPDRVAKEALATFRKNASTNQLEVNADHVRSSDNARRLFGQNGNGFRFDVSMSLPVFGFGLGVGSDRSAESDSSEAGKLHQQTSFSVKQLNDMLRQANLNVQWEGERFVVKPMRLVRINQREFRSRRELISHNVQLTVYQQAVEHKLVIRAAHNETWLLADSSKPGFPTEFSYCLLSNGGTCPPGFSRSSGYMKAVSMDTSSPGMIRNARLGDSAIKCHSPDDTDNCAFRGWEPYKGELHLHVCCR